MSEHRSKYNPQHDPEKKNGIPQAFVACRQKSQHLLTAQVRCAKETLIAMVLKESSPSF